MNPERVFADHIKKYDNRIPELTSKIEAAPITPGELKPLVEKIVDQLIDNIQTIEFASAATSESELMSGSVGEKRPDYNRDTVSAFFLGQSGNGKRLRKVIKKNEESNVRVIPTVSINCFIRIYPPDIAQIKVLEKILRDTKICNYISLEIIEKRLMEKMGDNIQYSIGELDSKFTILIDTIAGLKQHVVDQDTIRDKDVVNFIADRIKDPHGITYKPDQVNFSDTDHNIIYKLITEDIKGWEKDTSFLISINSETHRSNSGSDKKKHVIRIGGVEK
jgi:hypothetical protein